MNIPPIGTIAHPKVPNRNFFIPLLYPGPEIGDLPGPRHDWGVDKFVRKQRSADTTQSVVVIFLPPWRKTGRTRSSGGLVWLWTRGATSTSFDAILAGPTATTLVL